MKTTILGTLLIGLFSTTILGTSASMAAEVPGNKLQTEGTIHFVEKTDNEGEIITPDEETDMGEIPGIELPGGGESGKGSLRIQFVPNFKFGQYEGITAARTEANVLALEYNPITDKNNKKPIAPFVQVTDERGETGAAAKWDLTVSASQFVADKGGANEDTLEHAYIQLDGSTLTTTYGDSAKAKSLLNGQAQAKLTPGNSVSVMSTKEGQDTNGLQVSNVFHDHYKKEATNYENGRTSGVKFIKPAGQAPKKEVEYKATLTWTLTDAK